LLCYQVMEAKPEKPRHIILVVEDEVLVRLRGADILAEEGYEVLEAGNADEALRILEAIPNVRAVFSDVGMPGSLDGLGLAHSIYQRWPSIGVVLTSGHCFPSETKPWEGSFLPKPYGGQALVREIKEIVNQ
jgi:two-component system, response regulator PdtaR